MTIKKISFVGILLFLTSVTITQAQVGSPYSMLGLGEVANSGFGQSQAMGGIGLGIRSNSHLNSMNAAGYTALDSMSVIYEIGLSGGYNNIQSSTDNSSKMDGNIDYLGFGFKAKSFWGMGFGLTQYTRVNYTLLSETTSSSSGSYSTYYHGEGGLSKVYWTNSFNLFDNLSVGITTGYIFGNIQRVTSVQFNEYTPYTHNTKYDYRLNVNDIAFDFGLQYTAPINKDDKVVIGMIYDAKMNMNSKTNVYGITTNGTEYTQGVDYDIESGTVVDTIVNEEDIASSVALPSKLGIGFTYYHKNNLIVGADVRMQKWSELETDEIDDEYKDALYYNGGVQWTPDANSMKSYMKRIRYRMGAYYTQSHLVLKGQRIDDYGVSFGFGLPLKNSKTSFNISGQLGQRGTTNENLLRETYGIISLNLSLADIWFFKRKYK